MNGGEKAEARERTEAAPAAPAETVPGLSTTVNYTQNVDKRGQLRTRLEELCAKEKEKLPPVGCENARKLFEERELNSASTPEEKRKVYKRQWMRHRRMQAGRKIWLPQELVAEVEKVGPAQGEMDFEQIALELLKLGLRVVKGEPV